MTKRLLPTFLTTASALLAPSLMFGQAAEMGISFGRTLIRNEVLEAGEDFNLKFDDGTRFGLRLTLNTGRFTGHEVGYAYSRTKVVDSFTSGTTTQSEPLSVTTHQGTYGYLLYATPEGFPVRPFLVGGAHFSTYVPPGANVTWGQGVTKYGLNYGGGVKVTVTSMWGLRVDLREYRNPKPFSSGGQGWLRQIEVSAGASLVF
ncbi:MAG: hypothetical protein IPM24_14205 [Bryobacterales bacterium]|nr:hypothetical protein [Bryobacterales bacterium]